MRLVRIKSLFSRYGDKPRWILFAKLKSPNSIHALSAWFVATGFDLSSSLWLLNKASAFPKCFPSFSRLIWKPKSTNVEAERRPLNFHKVSIIQENNWTVDHVNRSTKTKQIVSDLQGERSIFKWKTKGKTGSLCMNFSFLSVLDQ